MQTGNILSIQRFSVHDGPGIRTTVFLKGCPLSCPWCHNPESQQTGAELYVLPDRCIDCWACSQDCPLADRWQDMEFKDGDRLAPAECDACGECVEVCPAGARRILGRTVDVEELLAEIQRDRAFFEQSGGGVTFSGGEPLQQPEFLLACLTACRDTGLHTTVDTCGYAGGALIEEVARAADLLLYDVKLLDDARHIQYVGTPVQSILANLRAVAEARAASTDSAAVWLRIPLLPGINDDEDTLDALASFVAELPAIDRVHLLPYHRAGTQKHERLGKHGPELCVEPPTAEAVQHVVQLFAAHGLDVRTGG